MRRCLTVLVAVLTLAVLTAADPGCSPPPGGGGTGAGGNNSHPHDDRNHTGHHPHYNELAFLVEWDPDNRPIDITYKIGPKVKSIQLYRNPFIKDFKYQMGDLVTITAHQRDQGWLRCAIDSVNGELDHQVTTAYGDSVTCSFRVQTK